MRHGADRHQPERARQPHIAGATQTFRDLSRKRGHHLILPGARKAPPGAEIGKHERVRTIECPNLFDLLRQTPSRFGQVFARVAHSGVQLADHCQQRHLEQYGVQPGAADRDGKLIILFADLDEAGLQVEQAQKLDEIGLEVALRGEEIQFLGIQAERAQLLDLALQFAGQRLEIHIRCATLETVFHLGARELMQHDVHHRELVDVGVEQ